MKKTKIIASLLVLVLVFSSIPALTLTASAATDSDSDGRVDLYTGNDYSGNSGTSYAVPSESIDSTGIDTYEELAFAIQNYGTEKFPAQVIELSNDIDMGGLTMESTIFGTLLDGMVIDGNGYAIKNLKVDFWKSRGLFNVAPNAHFTIKNLDFGTPDNYITARCGTNANWNNQGIILGNASFSVEAAYSFDIVNVDMYVNMQRSNGDRRGGVGIMIGKAVLAKDSSIKNCNVYGEITRPMNGDAANNNAYSAAFVSTLAIEDTNTTNPTLTIENCKSYATVEGGNCTAGFIGCHTGNVGLKIVNSVNYGSITSKTSSSATTAASMAGGFVGQSQTGNLTIDKCVNLGTVTGPSIVSGFVGRGTDAGSATITNSINAANVTAGADTAVSHFANGDGNKTISVTDSYNLATATLTGTETAYSGNSTLADLTAVADQMRALEIGYYVVEDGAVVVSALHPQYAGTQITPVATDAEGKGTISARFIAVLKDSNLGNFTEVGFKLTAACVEDGTGFEEKLSSNYVFTSLLAKEGNEGHVKVESYELDGEYIIAIAFDNVPATVKGEGDTVTDKTVNFTVTPYTIGSDGVTEYEGLARQIRFVGGEFVDLNA